MTPSAQSLGLMMTFPAGLNLTRCALHNRGEHGANQPQQIDLRVRSTASWSQINGPSEPVPHRLK